MGRSELPNKLKVLNNSKHQKRGNQPPAEKPQIWDVPRALCFEGAKLWKALLPDLLNSGIVTAADKASFELLCVFWGQIYEARKALSDDGLLLDDARKSSKKNPAFTALIQATAQFRALCADFGLNPVARDKAGFTFEPDLENEEAMVERFRKRVEERKAMKEMEALINP